MSSFPKKLESNNLLRICSFITLVLISFFVLTILFKDLGLNEVYEIIVKITLVVSYLICIPGLAIATKRTIKSLQLKRSVIVLVGFVFLFLMILSSGFILDAINVRCTDLWGWGQQSCASVVNFWVFYLFFAPVSFLCIMALISTLSVVGVVSEFRVSKYLKKKNRGKRA